MFYLVNLLPIVVSIGLFFLIILYNKMEIYVCRLLTRLYTLEVIKKKVRNKMANLKKHFELVTIGSAIHIT